MFEKVVRFLVGRSGKEYSAGYRTVATVLGASLFLVGWPALVVLSGRLFGETVLPSGFARILSIVCFVSGVPWVVWAVLWQLWKGKGTPVPTVPTRNFLPTGPYRFCRNPMMFGFFFYIVGWAAVFNQAGTYIAAAALMAFLLAEIKYVEEKELAERFGDTYLQYKKETSFFLPMIFRKKILPDGPPPGP